MVRIVRNDAPPLQTVNLLSDESNTSSKTSSTASSSSSSSDGEAEASSSPLSNFIEDDDGRQPLPKPSSSVWEPVKRRRKRIRTFRKKPRLDTVEADEEKSASTTSTSSEGIPRPEVEADADDEEEQVEPPTPTRIPSKRRRPRRAAAPRCFLDALNKYVQPMSKAASEYTNQTMREIWHDDSDSENSGEASEGSSVAFVPPKQQELPEEVVSVDNRRGRNRTSNFPPHEGGPFGSTESYRRDSSPVIHLSEGNATETDDAATVGNAEAEEAPKPQSPIPPSEGRHSLLDLTDTDEDEPLSTVVEKKQKERNEREEIVDAVPEHTTTKPQTSIAGCSPQNHKIELINLCSDEEDEVPTCANEFGESNVENIRDQSCSIKRRTQHCENRSEKKEQKRAGNDVEEDDDKNQHASLLENELTIEVDASGSSRKNMSPFDSNGDDGSSVSTPAERGTIHERNAQLAANLECTQRPQTYSQNHVVDISEERNAIVKSESSLKIVEYRNGHDIKSNAKGNASFSGGEEQRHIAGIAQSGQAQTGQKVALCSGMKITDSNLMSQACRPRHQFEGAKQRGKIPHPDLVNNRIPKSDREKNAWLEFIKAEARDMYRAFTAEPPARRFTCASTNVKYVRQILGALGKLIGLKVCSKQEGAGRRIIFKRHALETVDWSEAEIEKAVEGFFDDALADLTGQKWKKELTVSKGLHDGASCGLGDESASERKEENKIFTTPLH